MASASPGKVTNLDERAHNTQLRFGIGMMTAGLLLVVVLRGAGASPASHLLVAPLFFLGAYGIGSAMIRTCAMTAFVGRRRAEEGTEPVADRAELSTLRRRGAAVTLASAAFAVAGTVLLMVAR